jgi:2-succinyl-5-enolpyruvyl-6-hydroxy-3-cyclohexene-1-carboxylate synthase
MSRAGLTLWCEALALALAAAGVREVVASPGSRSTPFLAALLELSRTQPERLRCHLVVDERAAGFFALGMSRTTGDPAALLCTSGTAGAHYLPAVIEAERSGIPLVVLTADRPLELMDCGASQTIDQTRLFGTHAVAFVELGSPEEEPAALAALGRRVAQAVATSRWPHPGAVQLNARARKPLEPCAAGDPELAALRQRVGRLPPPPWFVPPLAPPDPAALDELAGRLRRAERSLIVCGPAPLQQGAAAAAIAELAARTGSPLLCEATSQLRFASSAAPAAASAASAAADALRIDAFDAVLRSPAWRAALAPDLVVQLGAPPTSSAWEAFGTAHPACPRAVISPRLDCDAQNGAALVVLGDVRLAVEGLLARLPAAATPAPAQPTAPVSPDAMASWPSRWRTANQAAWRAVSTLLVEHGASSEPLAVRVVAEALEPGTPLMVGNSLPVRELDSVVPAGAARCPVLCQRGASGIDGLIAGAAGTARAVGPTVLLLGDVSFLHDVGGLLAAQGAPLVVVVLNNGGGRIFEQLPVASAASTRDLLDHWTTPHQLDLAHAAALQGHRFARTAGPEALRAALREAQGVARAGGGCTVIEAVVDPVSATRFYAALPGAVEREAHP